MYHQKKREEIKAGVFQPTGSQPTMTLDEFAEMEMARMKEMQKQQEKMERLRKQEEEQDPDKDEVADKQTYKDREWDDWKDEHEKGAGNRKGR